MGLQNHKTFYLKKSQDLAQKLKKSWDIDITKLIHTLWSKVLVPANCISSLPKKVDSVLSNNSLPCLEV